MADSSCQLASENVSQDIPSTVQNDESCAFSYKMDSILAVYKDIYLSQSEKKLRIKKLANLPLGHHPNKARPKIPEIPKIPIAYIVDYYAEYPYSYKEGTIYILIKSISAQPDTPPFPHHIQGGINAVSGHNNPTISHSIQSEVNVPNITPNAVSKMFHHDSHNYLPLSIAGPHGFHTTQNKIHYVTAPGLY